MIPNARDVPNQTRHGAFIRKKTSCTRKGRGGGPRPLVLARFRETASCRDGPAPSRGVGQPSFDTLCRSARSKVNPDTRGDHFRFWHIFGCLAPTNSIAKTGGREKHPRGQNRGWKTNIPVFRLFSRACKLPRGKKRVRFDCAHELKNTTLTFCWAFRFGEKIANPVQTTAFETIGRNHLYHRQSVARRALSSLA